MSQAPLASLAYTPDVVYAAGAHLADWLDRAGMSQAEFARRVGLSIKHVNQIVKGHAGLTPEVALAFETVTSIPARFWMQLEANHKANQARRLEDLELEKHAEVLDKFPVKEMERRGYFGRDAGVGPAAKLRLLLQFFGVANVDALDEVALRPAALRPSRAFKPNEASLAAWLRRAELLAGSMDTAPFDADRCNAALKAFRSYTRAPGIEWLELLTERCAEVGIALVVEQELPGCRINGATRWLSPDRAMIALSLRYRRHDIVWFTFFHELAHLLRHSKRTTFVDAEGMGVPEELERDADRFASRCLIPPEFEGELQELATASDVVEFADRIGISPAIVVGRMRHENLIPHNKWARLIPHYRFSGED
jgi:HTH-type transcriptional regulator/antitoxin HigA